MALFGKGKKRFEDVMPPGEQARINKTGQASVNKDNNKGKKGNNNRGNGHKELEDESRDIYINNQMPEGEDPSSPLENIDDFGARSEVAKVLFELPKDPHKRNIVTSEAPKATVVPFAMQMVAEEATNPLRTRPLTEIFRDSFFTLQKASGRRWRTEGLIGLGGPGGTEGGSDVGRMDL